MQNRPTAPYVLRAPMLCSRALLLVLALLAAVPAAGGVALAGETPRLSEDGTPPAPTLPLTGSRQDATPGAVLPVPTRIAEAEPRQGTGPSPRTQDRGQVPTRDAAQTRDASHQPPPTGGASGAERCRLNCVYRL